MRGQNSQRPKRAAAKAASRAITRRADSDAFFLEASSPLRFMSIQRYLNAALSGRERSSSLGTVEIGTPRAPAMPSMRSRSPPEATATT